MPSKIRREREAKKIEWEKWFDKQSQNIPEWGKLKPGEQDPIFGGIEETAQACPELRLKGGLLEQDENGCVIERTDLMSKGGLKTGKSISDDCSDQAQHLKKRYSNIWGKRGAAKRIALTEKDISERTIQRYFKKFP